MRRASQAMAALALLAAACTVANPAPRSWQRSIAQAQRSKYGAWTIVELHGGKQLDGELIAVEPERLLLGSRGRLVPVAIDAIAEVTLSAYTADASGLVAGTGLGVLSTISHGWFLIFSAPLWALIGGGLSRSVSGEGFPTADDPEEIADLRKWARFPQGLPAGFLERKPSPPTRPPVPAAPRGGDGEVCYPNFTCNAGLECDRASGRCRPMPPLGGAGGRCYANGSCDAGLVCQEGTCAPPP